MCVCVCVSLCVGVGVGGCVGLGVGGCGWVCVCVCVCVCGTEIFCLLFANRNMTISGKKPLGAVFKTFHFLRNTQMDIIS